MTFSQHFNSIAFKISESLPILSVEQYDEQVKCISSGWAQSLVRLSKFNEQQKEHLFKKLTSKYKRLPELTYALKVVFLRLNGDLDHRFGVLSKDAKTSMIEKLSEDLPYCMEGFHDRVSEIILSFAQPKNLDDLLQLVREELILKTAMEESKEVHQHNAFFSVAHMLNLGVRFRNQHDEIGLEYVFDNYTDKLLRSFKNAYTPLSLPYLMCQYIKTAIAANYSGKKENPGYDIQDYTEITARLNHLLNETKSVDFYFSKHNVSVEYEIYFFDDLNWRQIEHLIIGKLCRMQYFKEREISDLPILTLQDVIYGSRLSFYEPNLKTKVYDFMFHSIRLDKQTLLCHESFIRESDPSLLKLFLQNQCWQVDDVFELARRLPFECWYDLMLSNMSFSQFVFKGVRDKLTWIQIVLFSDNDLFIDQKYLALVLSFFLHTLSPEEIRLLFAYMDNEQSTNNFWRDLAVRLKGGEIKHAAAPYYVSFISHVPENVPAKTLNAIYSTSEIWELFYAVLSSYTDDPYQHSFLSIVPFLKHQITKMDESSWMPCLRSLLGQEPGNNTNCWLKSMDWLYHSPDTRKEPVGLIYFLDFMIHVVQHLPQSHLKYTVKSLRCSSSITKLCLLLEYCFYQDKRALFNKTMEFILAIENYVWSLQSSIMSHSYSLRTYEFPPREKFIHSVAYVLFKLLLSTNKPSIEDNTVILLDALTNYTVNVNLQELMTFWNEVLTRPMSVSKNRKNHLFDGAFLIVCVERSHQDTYSKETQVKWAQLVMALLQRVSELNDALLRNEGPNTDERTEQWVINFCCMFKAIAKINQPSTYLGFFSFYPESQKKLWSPHNQNIRELYFNQLKKLSMRYESLSCNAKERVKNALRQDTLHREWGIDFKKTYPNWLPKALYNRVWGEESSCSIFCCKE